MRHHVAVAVLVALAGGAGAWANGPGPFTYSTPPGWLSVSKDSSAADRARIPEAMLAQIDSGKVAFYAADVDRVEDGFMANVNAIIRPGKPPAMTTTLLAEIQATAARDLKEMGFEYQAVKKDLVKIGGVDCAHIVGNMRTSNNYDLTTVGYVIPGREAAVTLSFTSLRSGFPRYEAIFDAAARQTQGAAAPPIQTPFWVYGISGAVSVLVYHFLMKGRRKKAANDAISARRS
jgi:hypothetical protein